MLNAMAAGDPAGATALLETVYQELRRMAAARMAAERHGHTLQPTALVHEACLRLVGPDAPGGRTAATSSPPPPRRCAACSSTTVAAMPELALPMREEVLATLRATVGDDHPDTLRAIHNLAISCEQAGRDDRALPLREELVERSRRVHLPQHPETLSALENLAATDDRAGRRDEAARLRAEVLEIRKHTLPSHPADRLRPPRAHRRRRRHPRATGPLKKPPGSPPDAGTARIRCGLEPLPANK